MQNKKCEICNTTFEGRENQKYCSDACKQKAYKNRKEGIEEIHETKNILMQFKMSEFKESNFSDLLMFCFFRKNYKSPFDANKFNKYTDGFSDNETFVKLENENTPEGKEFAKFKTLFFQGLYEIIE